MDRKLKILIITDEVWNDNAHGNNVMTNWFEGFNAEFANIYCNPGQPSNNICEKYFQITDMMMFKSILGGGKAGYELEHSEVNLKINVAEQENKRLYNFLKSVSTESLRALRDMIWTYGKYNEEKLQTFIEDFNPDIIFSPRMATLKLLRLERLVYKIANKPFLVFTGDDEYSLGQLRFSPIFWLRRFKLRSSLKKNMKLYSMYYTHSEEQGAIYSRIFNMKSKTLFKSSKIPDNLSSKVINKPIKLVYAGKLYCNRWKSLVEIVKVLKIINKDEIKMTLEIYTVDNLSKNQLRLLDDGTNSFVRGPVSPKELIEIYNNAHIALHVESLDIKNRLLTKYSFSTKIIDCLASSCAVLAICWDKQTGYSYLKKEDAAFCIDSYEKISVTLNEICDNPELINEYAEKAYNCIVSNHRKEVVQQSMYNDFIDVVESYRLKG